MNFKIKKYISLHAALLLMVILVAIFFRFYNTPGRYGFDYDPTRDALIVDYASKTLQFPLIGPPSGIGPFNFGPWYYYQLILFKIIFPVDYAPWIYIGIASTIVVFVMYKIGVLLKDKTLGLLLATLTALSPAETGQIRALSNPTLIPLYTILTIWMFIKFIKENSSSWMIFLWGLVLGIGINNHYQMLGLMPLPTIFFIYKKDKRWIKILAFTAGMFISFMPLIVFNFLHGWSTVKGLIFYITQGAGGIYIPNRWLFYVRDFWPVFLSYILGLPSKLGIYISIFIGLATFYLLIKRKISIIYIFLIITFGINFLVLRIFPGQREYYYLLYLHPFILIFFSLIILNMLHFKWGKYIVSIILLVVMVGMVSQSIERLKTSTDQAQFKKDAQEIINNFSDKKFTLYECPNNQKNRTRGVIFFLNTYNKVSENGIKLAYPNEKCPFPVGDKLSIQYLHTVNVVNISYASEKLLFEYGWRKITPKTVFEQLSQGTL
jgi:hypothetical protein